MERMRYGRWAQVVGAFGGHKMHIFCARECACGPRDFDLVSEAPKSHVGKNPTLARCAQSVSLPPVVLLLELVELVVVGLYCVGRCRCDSRDI